MLWGERQIAKAHGLQQPVVSVWQGTCSFSARGWVVVVMRRVNTGGLLLYSVLSVVLM